MWRLNRYKNPTYDSSGATKYPIFGKVNTEKDGYCYSTFTLPDDLTGYDYIVTRINGYSEILFEDMQLVEGSYNASNFPEFETYTGGRPSPNPAYPQDIYSVEEENLTVRGKNLLNFPQHYETYGYQNPVSQETMESLFALEPGKQYHVSRDYVYAERYERSMQGQFLVKDASGASLWFGNNTSLKLNERITEVIGFYCDSNTDPDGAPTIVENFQIEEGSVATSYVPYVPAVTYKKECILYGDADTKDTVDLVKGCITRRWDTLVMTGTEKYGYTDTNNWLTFVTGVITSNRDKALCTHLMNEVGGSSQNSFWWDSELKALRFSIQGFTSQEDYAAFFAEQNAKGTPVTIHYPLTTETKELIEAEDISLDAYVGKTALFSSDECFSGTVIKKPQIPSPQFSSKIVPTSVEKIMTTGKNLFNPYGEINYGLYSYHGSTYVGNNRVDENGNILVWNGSNGYLYGQQWKGLRAGTYTASFDVLDMGDAKGGIYAGITKNGKFASYTSSGGMGHYVYHVEVTENDWFCLFFGFSGATMKVTEKPIVFANVQLERGTEATTYMPYFNPSQQELPFELFGNGEVNDTCEPCVLVDGEWKCRVTRRWWKVDLEKYRDILVGIYKKKDDVTCFTISQLGLYTSEPAKTAGWQTSICSHFKNVNGSYDRFVPGLYSDQPSLTGMYFTVEGIKTVEEFRQWYIENKVVTMYQTAKPVVELYDPLPLRTIPRYTNISNDAGAEMSAKLKVVDV